MKKYVADFETTTLPEDCRVWAFAIVDIEDPDNRDNIIIGTDIYDFINWCGEQKGRWAQLDLCEPHLLFIIQGRRSSRLVHSSVESRVCKQGAA